LLLQYIRTPSERDSGVQIAAPVYSDTFWTRFRCTDCCSSIFGHLLKPSSHFYSGFSLKSY
jgi:hypothetical protein